MRAIEIGNQFQVKAAQEFYLRASETLRRLDLAVETERRNAEEQSFASSHYYLLLNPVPTQPPNLSFLLNRSIGQSKRFL
jgi:hypothetical protein